MKHILLISSLLLSTPSIATDMLTEWGASDKADQYHLYTCDGMRFATTTETSYSFVTNETYLCMYVTASNEFGESAPSNSADIDMSKPEVPQSFKLYMQFQ